MSIPTTSPTTPTQDRQNLEPLQELKLKGFGSCNDTPSSTTASLPTPGRASVPLANSAVIDDAPLGDFPDIGPNDWADHDCKLPDAPLMKDLDSFMDGTSAGSFASIPCAETDEQGNPLACLSEARLSMVSQQDKDLYVLDWLAGVETGAPQASFSTSTSAFLALDNGHPPHVPTLKRPRSLTEYEEYRPRRPRTRSCPSSRRGNSLEPD